MELAIGLAGQQPRRNEIITRHCKQVVAATYGIKDEDLVSPCRKREFAHPRQLAMFLARDLTTKSYPQIGRCFGDRDHTTVMFAHRKVSKMLQEDENLRAVVDHLRAKIREAAGVTDEPERPGMSDVEEANAALMAVA